MTSAPVARHEYPLTPETALTESGVPPVKSNVAPLLSLEWAAGSRLPSPQQAYERLAAGTPRIEVTGPAYVCFGCEII